MITTTYRSFIIYEAGGFYHVRRFSSFLTCLWAPRCKTVDQAKAAIDLQLATRGEL